MTDARLTKAISRFVKKVRDERIDGIVGRGLNYADVAAPRNNHIWVTIADSATQIRNTGPGRVLARAGLPVKLIRRYNGDLVLDGNDISGLLDDDDNAPGDVFSVNSVLPDSHGNVTLDPDDLDDSATTHKFTTAADISKLAGIEAGAEVNVNADWNAVTGDALILNKPTIPAETGAAIHAATGKTTPVDADELGLADSAASFVLKKLTWANLKATIKTYYDSVAATLTNKTLDSTNISTLTSKTTPVDADSVVIVDSAASNFFKRVTGTNWKAYMKTYFDTLYGLLASANTWTQQNQFNPANTTGVGLGVTRNLAAASTDSPVVSILNDHASDDQPTAVIGQDAPADILQLLDGGTKVFVAFDGGNIGAGVSAITDIYSGFLSTNPRVLQVNEPTSTSGTGRPAALILSATKTTGGDNIGSVYFCNLNNAGAEKRIVQFGAFTGTDSDDGIFFVLVAKDGVANEVFRVDEDGQMGIGTQAPQGKHHVHDGTGGSMFVTKTAVAGTKVVIIPNATGDVLSSVTCMYALANSDGTKIGSTFNCPVSGSVPVTVGGTTWTFSVAANGEFSVIRTAGTDTAIIAMQLVWR